MEKLSASLEDYLEIIYNSANKEKYLRAVDISKELQISRASVAEALRKLVSKGFINYDRHDSISLTEIGENIAKKIVSKHTILQRFFETTLELTEEEASENACRIEHVITDNAFKKISEYINKQDSK